MTKEEEKDAVKESQEHDLQERQVPQEETEEEPEQENMDEVAQVPPPPDGLPLPDSTFSRILTRIIRLKKVVTPVTAIEIAKAVREVPYLAADLKQKMAIAATNYESACVAHASFLENGASTQEEEDDNSVPEGEASEIEGRMSTLKTEKSNLEEEVSVLERQRPVLEAERLSLQKEEARLEGERAALEAQRSRSAALEQDEEILALRAARDLSDKKVDLFVKTLELERAVATKKEALAAKTLVLERALAAKALVLERALVAKEAAAKEAFNGLDGLHSEIRNIIDSFSKAKTTLQIGSLMSQRESTMASAMQMTEETYNAVMASAAEGQGGAGLPESVMELVGNITVRDMEAFRSADSENLNVDRLKRLVALWSALIMNCFIIPDDKDATIKKELFSVLKDMRASLTSDTDTWPKEGMSYPFANLKTQEVNSAQPIFMALMDMISDCCKEDGRVNGGPFTPPKTEVKKNTIIMGADNRPKRVQDASFAKPGRFRLKGIDKSMKPPVEVKPVLRAHQSPDKLDMESFHQMYGHLCKSAFQFLEFLGTGVSSLATGVTATVAYIIIHRLRLDVVECCDASTPVATLHLEKSVRLPTMTETCFNAWYEKCKAVTELTQAQLADMHSLKEDLYGTVEKKKESVDVHGIPLAIRALCDIMGQRTKDLIGPDYEEMFHSCGSDNIGELLGTGSFGIVFSYRMEGEAEASAVLKVPLLQNSVHLERELNILRLLERQEDLNTTIDEEIALPVVMMVMNDLSVNLGGAKHLVTGFVFRPQGKPLASSGRELLKVMNDTELERLLVKIWSQIKAALEFMHRMKVFHNDVTPKNIVVLDADWNVCLVDFGSAFHDCGSTSGNGDTKENYKTGFDGTPNFAHMDIFLFYPGRKWTKLDGTYDFFGLSLTICALLNEGKACWNMSPFPATISTASRANLNVLLKERKIQAINMIDKFRFSEDQKNEWVKWISCENVPDPSPCQSPAIAASAEESSHIPFQGTETESLLPPSTPTTVRSGTKRKKWGTLRSLFSKRGGRGEQS